MRNRHLSLAATLLRSFRSEVIGVATTRSLVLLATTCLMAVALISACGQAGNTSSSAGSGQFALLPTKKCQTTQGLVRPAVPLEDTTSIPVSPEGLGGFAAFTNATGSVLVGPEGWRCESTVGVNGSMRIGLSPDGRDPFEEQAELGVTLSADPACQGCIASQICAVFPDAPVVVDYANFGVSCDRTKPLRETLTRIGEYAALFEDPPGVRGTGQPSGGEVPSVGMISYSEQRGSTVISCAVPRDLEAACPSIVSGSMVRSLLTGWGG